MRASGPPQNPPPNEFFRGAIASFDATHVTVTRKLVGRSAETRTFVIRPETHMDKPLRVHAKVTVHFQHEADADVALEIHFHSNLFFLS